MNELQKAAAGLLYDANYDPALLAKRRAAKRILFEINNLHPDEDEKRTQLLKGLLGKTGQNITFDGQFHCDYGFNIEVGENFYANVNLVILDGAKVTIGNNCFIAPNVGIYTAGHPLDAERRNKGLEYAHPITIGDDVWIGAGVTVLPGASIGSGSVIAAGSVVRGEVPPNVICGGNPGNVIREINERDSQKYR
ncbi:sugar O-acetyltransferase [Ketogulonicigenium vulgare]|uniref:Acetyltransferase n=1 Tax=Ketogulonicigenium vulgare (strain WSH-001) TaxID=759362 RepID=F9Y9R0_KETVW|nr:sugar O-acetyltransferase [Ketogulonicigenium vulgare]ADO43107.1 Putative acetyltransferase [Ketogulonicigenium vulgare Y25]AEM41398.1 Acetyltransferase (Isoleucine patch superfamily) [Ketogulonicigenium vulgare WSH-001]ALJ81532.1 maltose acetyltransferase [Ketogulonicigenium vulgare]ANW34232.1 maltose acetyltransferase [Ketogulonicigenium vulgare]AOZ55142.1 acetyltransferase [Ketogulonicigenium vulgare]